MYKKSAMRDSDVQTGVKRSWVFVISENKKIPKQKMLIFISALVKF